MDLSTWFHWIFPSPGYLLLALAGLLVLIGLIGGLTDTRKLGDAHNSPPDAGEPQSGMPWWNRDEEHYREWNVTGISYFAKHLQLI
jgi:hypothetical protein